MNEKKDIIQILGVLMKRPTLLSQTDKYSLSIDDFSGNFEKYIFDAIETLYHNGANKIKIIDVENALSANQAALAMFRQNKGQEYLEDAIDFSEEENFDYYYNHLKKINALKQLRLAGVDTSEFYCEDLTNKRYKEINDEFEKLTINDLFEAIKKKILKIEQNYLNDDVSETKNVFEGIEDLLEESFDGSDIGLPIQGKYMTMVMSGARRSTFALRSGGSGLGKSRNMVGDACLLAFPFRYNPSTCEWEHKGSSEKVLYITTEQSIKEIQRMILAYLTGINESKFRYGQFTREEKTIISQAKEILEVFKDNFLITQMPSPTNELVKTVVREQCILNDIGYVFFDYIFISPALLREFKGTNLRNDKILSYI